MFGTTTLLGLDNYYEPYYPYARNLSIRDVGENVMKVERTPLPGGLDSSYVGEVYTVVNVVWEPRCDSCHKPAATSCAGCLNVHYCSRECQKKLWIFYKSNCAEKKCTKDNDSYQHIRSVTLEDKKGQLKTIDTTDWYAGKQYIRGWVRMDEVKDVRPDGRVSSSHIDDLRRMEKY